MGAARAPLAQQFTSHRLRATGIKVRLQIMPNVADFTGRLA
jgi:hypothetical protein